MTRQPITWPLAKSLRKSFLTLRGGRYSWIDISRGSLPGLPMRLFIHRKDDRAFRRVQVQCNDIGRLGGKFQIGTCFD